MSSDWLFQRQQTIDYGAMCVVFDFNNVRQSYNTPQLPYPYPYQQHPFQTPHGRDELESILDEVSSTTTSTSAPVNPWDIFVDTLLPTPPVRKTIVSKNTVYVAPEEQKIIQPVLKNQYLTKLQRELLPPPPHLVADFDQEKQLPR